MEVKSEKQKQRELLNIIIFVGIIIGSIASTVTIILNRNIVIALGLFVGTPTLLATYVYFRGYLKQSLKVKKMEFVFPDFLQLMSSNLRAGITIDKSMLLSVREEFDPLDKEIEKTGREITTGREIELALLDMSKRINSEKIQKTIQIIITGLRSGGNISTLLEETAVNLREKGFVEKRAASNVLMYVIFIFLAVALGAPALFGLSSVLVEVLASLLSDLPQVDTSNLAFSLTAVSISPVFIKYFAIVFIIVTDILASLVLGLVSTGEEKDGLRYTIPLVAISLTIFFIVRIFLSGYLKTVL